MSGDFEKNISHQLESFQLNPGPQVWERVAAALPEKRRRRFAIWWLLPLAACLCVGVWLIIDGKKNRGNASEIVEHHTSSDSNTNKQSVTILAPADTVTSYAEQKRTNKKPSVILKKSSPDKETAGPAANKTVTGKRVIKKQQPSETAGENNQTDNNLVEVEGALLKRNTYPAIREKEDVAYVLANATRHIALPKGLLNDSVFFKAGSFLPPLVPAIIPSPEIVAKNDTALSKKSDSLLKTSVEIKIPEAKNKSNKVAWSLIVGVGKSSLTNRSSDMNKALDAGNFGNPVGQTSYPGSFSNPISGFNGSAGFMRQQAISKNVSWQAAMSYQFLTATQRVGSRNDSLVQFDAFTNTAFYTSNRTASSVGTIRTNQVHRLQVASDMRYTFNPQVRWPISFFTGASIACNLSNNVLLHDYRSNSYIRSTQLSNKFMLAWEAGTDIFINHKIYAGIFYQHDFTNVARPKVGSAFRWNQLQLRIGVPLSKYK